jgi:CubicO group peptidase (beta-lactamase class C family)
MFRKVLLLCGIFAAVIYAAADIAAGLLYPGYIYTAQTVSELSAIGAPTRSLWMTMGILYTLFLAAFGWGIWMSAHRKRLLRVVAALLIFDAVFGLFWPPMHQRGTQFSLTNTLHIVWTIAHGVLMLLAMGFAAAVLGKRFRIYSIATMLIMIAFGALTGVQAPGIAANLPTPWIGVWERINIAAFLVWLIVFTIALWREPGAASLNKKLSIRQTLNEGTVQGLVRPGFERVYEAFADNFVHRNELGGACCVYHHGEKVVDVWGGIRNRETGEPWEQNTMVLVYSATKGLAAMTLAIAHSRGWLDYEERVCTYWPEFAQQGKERITVRQLLAHQAGLFAIDEPVDRSVVADLDQLAIVLARQKPKWEPGTRQAYHAVTLGFYEGELLRRVDPKHRSLGQFFQDEIATPLGLDAYIRLPDSIPNSRLATLAPLSPIEMLRGYPISLTLDALNTRSNIYRALLTNPGGGIVLDEQRVYARNLEVPSGGGVGTARGIAHAYSVFATDGRELGLRRETLRLLAAPAIPPKLGFHDECMRSDNIQFSLGFMKPSPQWPFGSYSSFGAPGSGGSLGFADPTTGIGYAYVTSRMGTALTGDPRDVALRQALYAALSVSPALGRLAA